MAAESPSLNEPIVNDIRDRVWQTQTQLELAIIEYVAWFNSTRLHQALGDRPPAEAEALYAARTVLTPSLNQ